MDIGVKNEEVTALKISYFDTVPVGSAISVMKNGFVHIHIVFLLFAHSCPFLLFACSLFFKCLFQLPLCCS